jgi:hypothetical protein
MVAAILFYGVINMAKPKKEKFSSFETTEYSGENTIADDYSVIAQIVKDKERTSPSFGVTVSFQGDLVKIAYHTYESMLPQKMTVIMAEAKQRLDEAVKFIKKEFKSKTKRTIDLKEKKDMANYSTQKVSMNERYYAIFWRYYEVQE